MIISNKQSSLKYYGARMTKFSANPYTIFQRFKCYTTLFVKELLYNEKSNFLLLFQKFCNLHKYIAVTNISNNIIKQYYGIIKLFKVLVIVKNKQFSRTYILI